MQTCNNYCANVKIKNEVDKFFCVKIYYNLLFFRQFLHHLIQFCVWFVFEVSFFVRKTKK